jgi:hypothetical protein
MLSLITLLLALGTSVPALSVAPRPCIEKVVRVHITADTMDIQIPTPRDQSQLTSLITEITSQTSNITSSVKKGPELDTAYDIWAQLCVPAKFPRDGKGILEFAIHGYEVTILDLHSDSYLSFVESTSIIRTGTLVGQDHSTTMLMRLWRLVMPSLFTTGSVSFQFRVRLYRISVDELQPGVGKSSKPDGIKEVQLSTEIEVAAALVQNLKTRQDFDFQSEYNKAKIIGVGHSYGRYDFPPS